MAESSRAAPTRVFMSYRREETAYAAAWLYDRLAKRFSGGQVFKDVDSIELGDDFVEEITRAVDSCDVLLALIGDRWLTIADAEGKRRIDNAEYFVRLEIEVALTRNVRVIPVLVEGARMPRADELPTSIAKLAHRQALELSASRFEFDLSRLLRALDSTLSPSRASPQPKLPSSPALVTLKRPILTRLFETPARRVVALGDEVLRLGNAGGSSAIKRSLTFRRVGNVSVSVDLSQARAISDAGGVRFRNAQDAKADLQNAVARHYSMRVGEEFTYEGSLTIEVPANRHMEVVLHWKLIWTMGMASLAESASPVVTIAEVPFEIARAVTVDPEQRNIT
jgi:hypothetical protein